MIRRAGPSTCSSTSRPRPRSKAGRPSPSTSSFITVHPAGTTKPGASNLDNTGGVTRADLVVVEVGAGATHGGKVSLLLSTGQSHLIADVAGYFVE